MTISRELLVGRDSDTRPSAIDEAHDWMRELVRDGSASVRVVFDDVPADDWVEIEGRDVWSPDGPCKRVDLAIGVQLLFHTGEADLARRGEL